MEGPRVAPAERSRKGSLDGIPALHWGSGTFNSSCWNGRDEGYPPGSKTAFIGISNLENEVMM